MLARARTGRRDDLKLSRAVENVPALPRATDPDGVPAGLCRDGNRDVVGPAPCRVKSSSSSSSSGSEERGGNKRKQINYNIDRAYGRTGRDGTGQDGTGQGRAAQGSAAQRSAAQGRTGQDRGKLTRISTASFRVVAQGPHPHAAVSFPPPRHVEVDHQLVLFGIVSIVELRRDGMGWDGMRCDVM